MALDEKTAVMARDQIVLAFEERDEQIAREHGKRVSELNRRGMLFSSVSISQVTDLYANEIKFRGELAFGCLKRALGAIGLEPYGGLGDDLKRLLHVTIERQSEYLRDRMRDSPVFKHETTRIMDGYVEAAWVKPIEHARMRASSEVDLYVSALGRAARAESGSGVVIHGHVGAIQTGPHSTANVVMTIDVSTREELQQVLSELTEQLRTLGEDQPFSTAEVGELARDCLEEARKDKPNGTKLRTLSLELRLPSRPPPPSDRRTRRWSR